MEVTLVRSNFDHVDEFMTTFARRFDRNRFFALAPAIPSGLANRESYVERELLTEAQLEQVRDPAFARRLQSLAPPGVAVSVSDNFFLQFHPEQVKRGEAADQMLEIEPNGAVRGLIIYEGVVGNVLEEPLDTLWRRAQQRVHDPVVVAELGGAKTMAEWATAARNIDQHFASEEDRRRIHERRVHSGHPNRRSLPQLRHADASVEP